MIQYINDFFGKREKEEEEEGEEEEYEEEYKKSQFQETLRSIYEDNEEEVEGLRRRENHLEEMERSNLELVYQTEDTHFQEV